jgi:hypothetical protein
MKRGLKTLLPAPVLDTLRAWRADRRDAREWGEYQQKPVTPPPHVVKARTVVEYGRRFALDTLVETGTFEGEMARKCSGHFQRVITIELHAGLAAEATRRLARLRNVHVLAGDSARVLPGVLASLGGPALFWLDGHFSGGGTARGERDTPLLAELEAIGRHRVAGHVVLIDDARLLGAGDYPSLDEIRERFGLWHPGSAVKVADDIVRVTPPGAGRA